MKSLNASNQLNLNRNKMYSYKWPRYGISGDVHRLADVPTDAIITHVDGVPCSETERLELQAKIKERPSHGSGKM